MTLGLAEIPKLELISDHPHAHFGLSADTADLVSSKLLIPLNMQLQPRTPIAQG